eukprot:scaffold167_cov347-Prasinococcus_capsulatus_cf.AAC.5
MQRIPSAYMAARRIAMARKKVQEEVECCTFAPQTTALPWWMAHAPKKESVDRVGEAHKTAEWR